MHQIKNNKILEAVNRGIQLALDDYEDIEDNNSTFSDIITSSNFDKYVLFKSIIKRLLTNDTIYPRKLDQIAAFKELVQLHNDYRFLYKVHTLEELKDIINKIIDIWPTATNNFNWLDVSSITSLNYAFSSSSIRDYKIGKVIIDEWDVSNVTNMAFMAWNCKYFDADLSKWDVHNVQYAGGAFLGCKKFNSDLSNWNVSNLKDAGSMFLYCDEFNSNISKWNTGSLIAASQMFKECKKFNCDLSNWDVSNIQQAPLMFWGCENFDQDLSKWNLAKCNNGNRDHWFRQMFEKTPMEYKFDLYPQQLITLGMKVSAAWKKKI